VQTVCAILTPLGRGAVASVGVRGPRSWEIAGRLFAPASGRPLSAYAPGQVVFGRFRLRAEAAEELVVGLFGPEEIEIHCHGGIAAVKAVVAALTAAGCVKVTAKDWASLTEADPLRAAAIVALSSALTERTAAILLDQYYGALREELTRIAGALDARELAAADAALDLLLGDREFGLHLTVPWKVALAGRPNVGKSSLINALLGYRRAIVFDQPGTTRDVLTAAAAFDGWPVELADMAGIRDGGDAIEAEGVARARQQLTAADLVVLVVDATTAWTSADRELLTELPAVLVVHNKCDLASPPDDGRPSGIAISAKTGLGLDELVQWIAEALVPAPPQAGAAVPFTAGQIAALEQARAALMAGDSAGARRQIELLLIPGVHAGIGLA
jgi:tRNA modification GTPase